MGFLSVLLIDSLAVQKLFSFMKCHLSSIGFHSRVNWVLSLTFFPISLTCRISPMFSLSRFCISAFMFRTLIHLELAFTQSYRYGHNFIFCTRFSQHHSLKDYFKYFFSMISASLSNLKWLKLFVLMFGPLILLHWSMCLVSVSNILFLLLWICNKSGMIIPQALHFLLRMFLTLRGLCVPIWILG